MTLPEIERERECYNFCGGYSVVLKNYKTAIKLYVSVKYNNILLFSTYRRKVLVIRPPSGHLFVMCSAH
jgi:hypothetical protein